ncbi:hypothetical protein VIBNIAM115_790135 [Vibrio nigripulchritudo AM115]|nr:hypothetical protein VIBNIAM115_790135 [Vibrio nigripulchritudo AM115]
MVKSETQINVSSKGKADYNNYAIEVLMGISCLVLLLLTKCQK